MIKIDLTQLTEEELTATTSETRTTPNYAKATFDALKQSYKIVTPKDWGR